MDMISLKTLSSFVRKMRIANGDIIAIKSSTPLANKVMIDALSESIAATGRTKCVIVVVDSFDDLKVLDEKAMNERGWFYVDTLRKIIHDAEIKTLSKEEDEDESPAV